ncbi:MAG: DUF3703 domain-containing protein [Cyclobacteriaceae bacterium]|jgi:hypothetical protein|nr:DUF3703 domain-containing protein [Cyclobacteriaceae bacterium]MCU0369112.1 DUF3703 domain-containing protein [Cyclobacteriaceae bacterium]HCZ36188.1 hypothetical protein [Cytophagales bacterium]
MKLYWKMPDGLKVHYHQELNDYKKELAKGNLQVAWRHLERAHILGQPWPIEHSEVHWVMLKFGIRIKDTREIIGQIPRLLVGGVKSFVGTIPVGNTGGADVPPLRPMEIPEDLQAILKPYRTDK